MSITKEAVCKKCGNTLFVYDPSSDQSVCWRCGSREIKIRDKSDGAKQ
jgi:ribosomal protein S27E